MLPSPCRRAVCRLTVLFLVAVAWTGQARAQEDDADCHNLDLSLPYRPLQLPEPPSLRTLAESRLQAVAVELDYRFKEFLAGRGTDAFLIDAAIRWRDAFSGLSFNLEWQLIAWEKHLHQMLECERIAQARLEAGRISTNPFRSAVANAKLGMAEKIFAQTQPASAEVLVHWWIELGSPDVIHASRARWSLQAAGPEIADFLRNCVQGLPPPGEQSRALIAVSDGLGEVVRQSALDAAAKLGKEKAAEQRRLLRALDLLEEMEKEGGR